MKYLFIDVTGNLDSIKIPDEIKSKPVGLVATVQYMHLLKNLQKKFKKPVLAGQVTGCDVANALKIKDKVDCFFILAEGRFHAIEIALKTRKPVYVATGDKISEFEIHHYEKRIIGKKIRFYTAKNLGILVSLKPGQYNLHLAEKLREKYSKTKNVYIFIDDTFNIPELENFKGIDMFINTACSRIESSNIINAGDLGGE